jgi:general secretion pathway protein F
MQFQAKVLSENQELAMLQVTANSDLEASRQLKNQGYVVLSINELKSGFVKIGQSKSRFPLLLFSRELFSLLKAGLNLVDAIETLQEKEHRPFAKAILTQVMTSLYEGLPFSTALEKAQGAFPPLYIALIRSSERTGDLPEALKRYVEYQTQVDIVKKKVVSASIYPTILMIVGGMVILFLMLYVVPKFSVIFASKGDNLPWMSKLLLAWGNFLHENMAYFLGGFVIFVGMSAFLLTRPAVRKFLVELIVKLPLLKEQIRVYQLSRFYRTLGMLLRGGIPIMQAIDMVSSLLQPGLQKLLSEAAADIKRGVTTSQAMESHSLTTPVAVRMMRVGEQSGQMGEMMESIGNFYDEEIEQWVDWFTRLFEPILMVFIGLVIGVIVVMMYMPIFELADSIQ